jgi:hypothetical protein
MRIARVILIRLALAAPPAAQEVRCPGPIQLEDIAAAPGCLTAHALYAACAWGHPYSQWSVFSEKSL